MELRRLGHTDLSVSVICLGTMTWGEQNTEAEAHAQLDYAMIEGVNFIDTAEMYPVPPRAETQGRTESYIGSWLANRKNRDRVILATKVAGPSRGRGFDHIRYGQNCLSADNITQAVEDSLRRLRTDYIDLYQLHWPDRITNYFGELGYTHHPEGGGTDPLETLEALGELVQAGKIRHVGISNETPWGMMRFLHLAEKHGLPRMVSIQNPYNLLNRSFEIGLAECAIREHCGLLAYSPLAFGVLSGKYLNGQHPPGARLTLFERFQRYTHARAETATARYVALARQYGLDPAQMALRYVADRPFVTSVIIGASTMEQLKSDIASINTALPPKVLEGIEAIHRDYPNPCP